jgi:hypothetical protein
MAESQDINDTSQTFAAPPDAVAVEIVITGLA